MPQIVTAIDIDAPPSKVFEILVDSSRYEEWNPLLRLLVGSFRPGSRILAKIMMPGVAVPFVFDAKVVRCDAAKGLAWRGPSVSLVHPVVSGEHYFDLMDLGNGRTRFVHGERFDGILPQVERLWDFLEGKLRPAYEGFNEALKRRAEAAG